VLHLGVNVVRLGLELEFALG